MTAAQTTLAAALLAVLLGCGAGQDAECEALDPGLTVHHAGLSADIRTVETVIREAPAGTDGCAEVWDYDAPTGLAEDRDTTRAGDPGFSPVMLSRYPRLTVFAYGFTESALEARSVPASAGCAVVTTPPDGDTMCVVVTLAPPP